MQNKRSIKKRDEEKGGKEDANRKEVHGGGKRGVREEGRKMWIGRESL